MLIYLPCYIFTNVCLNLWPCAFRVVRKLYIPFSSLSSLNDNRTSYYCCPRNLNVLFFFLLFFTSFGSLHALFTEEQIRISLEVHNEFRIEYGVRKNLTWSKNLANTAEEYAKELKCDKFDHSDIDGCGENLYTITKTKYPVSKGMHAWANEIRLNEPRSHGHAIQMLWSDTVLVGCGAYIQGCMTLVCHYFPPGNYEDSTYSDVTEDCSPVKEEPIVNVGKKCDHLYTSLLKCNSGPIKRNDPPKKKEEEATRFATKTEKSDDSHETTSSGVCCPSDPFLYVWIIFAFFVFV